MEKLIGKIDWFSCEQNGLVSCEKIGGNKMDWFHVLRSVRMLLVSDIAGDNVIDLEVVVVLVTTFATTGGSISGAKRNSWWSHGTQRIS